MSSLLFYSVSQYAMADGTGMWTQNGFGMKLGDEKRRHLKPTLRRRCHVDSQLDESAQEAKFVSHWMKCFDCAWRKVRQLLTQVEAVSCLRKLPKKVLRFMRWRAGS